MFETFNASDANVDMSRNAAAATAGKCPTPRIDSHRLMAGQRALVIEHAGQEYHLRVTRNDKLILTK